MKAWDELKGMITELEQRTECFSNPDLLSEVLKRSMDVIEAATAVSIVAKDGIEPTATLQQLVEAVESFKLVGEPLQVGSVTKCVDCEGGGEHDFRISRICEIDGRQYAALYPLKPEELKDWDEGGVALLRLEEKDGKLALVDITDDTEWERAAEEMEAMLEYEDEPQQAATEVKAWPD